MFRGTLKELSEKLKVDYLVMQGVVKYLEMTKQAEAVGKVAAPSGRGKPSTIYQIKCPAQIFNEESMVN